MRKYFWQTEHVRLRQIEPDDWRVFYDWEFDSETMRSLVESPPFPKSVALYKQ